MTNPERSNELPATLEQASALLTEVGTLTTLQGKNYGDRNTYSVDLDTLPSEIAAHLPTPEQGSKVSHSAYVVQIFDRETGQPKRQGVVGTVSITQHEKPDPNLTYAAHVNYHVTTENDGETYDLERHVTNTEHGSHMVRALGRTSVDPAKTLEELTALRDRVEAERPVEKAMGMFMVTQAEAQQVIDLTKAFNG